MKKILLQGCYFGGFGVRLREVKKGIYEVYTSSPDGEKRMIEYSNLEQAQEIYFEVKNAVKDRWGR